MVTGFYYRSTLLTLLLLSVEGFSILTVLSPSELKFSNGMSTINQTVEATFGLPVYRGGLTGPIVYATPEDRKGCVAFDKAKVQEEFEKVKIQLGNKPLHPMILAVDRGSCTFAEKVLHAQDAGADAVLVFDNEPDKNREVFMVPVSQWLGESIKIPSMMISKKDGDKIRDSLLAETITRVVVSMRWLEPHKSETVTFDFWTDSGDQSLTDLLLGQPNGHRYDQGIFPFTKLKTSLIFHPRYHVIDGEMMGCTDAERSAFEESVTSEEDDLEKTMEAAFDKMMDEVCKDSCVNGGRYCTSAVFMNTAQGLLQVTGRELMKMNLLQICIREHSKLLYPDDTVLTAWWEVNRYFFANCVYEQADFSMDCAMFTLSKRSPSKHFNSVITACMDDNLHGGKSPMLHREVLPEQSTFSITDTAIGANAYINRSPYLGSLLCGVHDPRCSIFEAICAAYAPNSVPSICTQTETCPLTKPRDICGVCGGNGSSCTWTLAQLVKWTGTIFLLFAIVVVIYTQNRYLCLNLQRIEKMYEPLLEFAPKKMVLGTDTSSEDVCQLPVASLFNEEQENVEKAKPMEAEKEEVIVANTIGQNVVKQDFDGKN